MKKRASGRIRVFLVSLAAACSFPELPLRAEEPQLSESAKRQIEAILRAKAARTPAQRKIDSGLLRAIAESRGESIAPGVPLVPTSITPDETGRVTVDVEADVTSSLLLAADAAGAINVEPDTRLESVRMSLPLAALEGLAARPEVRTISRKADYVLNGPRAGGGAPGAIEPLVGGGQAQGDACHRADVARSTYGYDGSGVRVGVLSDSIAYLVRSLSNGNLNNLTVVSGLAGLPGQGEGTAMLEIVRDVAPGAALVFATGTSGSAAMASAIATLAGPPYSCQIIVDDVTYLNESPFQDGPIAQAVNTFTAAGGLYFSSAGNSGNVTSGTSGVWEGDYADGGTQATIGGTHHVHSFGSGISNKVTSAGLAYTLYWSDPLNGSGNDYDLFVLDDGLTTVLDSSSNDQTGTQSPYEQTVIAPAANHRLVIVNLNNAATARALHLDTWRGRLETSTIGQTKGHSAAVDAMGVAATPAVAPGPFPGPFTAANSIETFSSDGPRRVFYEANGTPITPGNLLFGTGGGTLRQKPDITAADGVSTSVVPQFASFYGTSAAAPHAAGIAALIKSAKPADTAAQIRARMKGTAIDIGTPGVDRDSGSGIIMADAAIAQINPTKIASLLYVSAATVEAPGANANGSVEPGESVKITVTLKNGGAVNATSVSATLAMGTPAVTGVTVTTPGPFTIGSGTLTPGASGSNGTPFVVSLGSDAALCGVLVPFDLSVTFGGGAASPVTVPFYLVFAPGKITISGTLDPTPPPTSPKYTATGGQQTGRLNRSGRGTDCLYAKANPGLFTATGSRRYDAYTLANTLGVAKCFTAKLTTACNSPSQKVYLAVYNTNGYVPATPNVNYIADFGFGNTGEQTASWTSAIGANYTVVVHEVDPATTDSAACPYVLTIDGQACVGLGGLHGDIDASGQRNVADVLYGINYLFAGGPPPLGFADCNNDGVYTVADVLYLINNLFAGGPAPV